jgi:hypothetical protein
MQTHQLHVTNGGDQVDGVRRTLFAFPEILEVFTSGRPDTLLVVFDGRPRLGEWLARLRATGYEVSVRDLRRAIVDTMITISGPGR